MSSQDLSVLEAKPLLTGLVIGESPRWHEDRLWFANWGTEEIVAVDLEGNAEVVAKGPPGLGWSIDWLPDGRLLVTGQGLTRREPDGSMVPHADLSAWASTISMRSSWTAAATSISTAVVTSSPVRATPPESSLW